MFCPPWSLMHVGTKQHNSRSCCVVNKTPKISSNIEVFGNLIGGYRYLGKQCIKMERLPGIFRGVGKLGNKPCEFSEIFLFFGRNQEL